MNQLVATPVGLEYAQFKLFVRTHRKYLEATLSKYGPVDTGPGATLFAAADAAVVMALLESRLVPHAFVTRIVAEEQREVVQLGGNPRWHVYEGICT